MDWITCPGDLSVGARRRLYTTRRFCRTIVTLTDLPVMCPTCGMRVA